MDAFQVAAQNLAAGVRNPTAQAVLCVLGPSSVFIVR